MGRTEVENRDVPGSRDYTISQCIKVASPVVKPYYRPLNLQRTFDDTRYKVDSAAKLSSVSLGQTHDLSVEINTKKGAIQKHGSRNDKPTTIIRRSTNHSRQSSDNSLLLFPSLHCLTLLTVHN